MIYSKDNRSLKDTWTWYILLYNTKNNNWSEYHRSVHKSFGGIYGFYYLRKCRKVIFAFGKPIFSDEVFHKAHDTRRGFNLKDFFFIYLDKPKNDLNSYGFTYIDSYLDEYIENKYANKHVRILQKIIDYTVEVNNGVIYIVYRINLYSNGEYTVNIVTLEYNMCTDGSIKSFEIELHTPITEVPNAISEDTPSNENVLLYLSAKRLRGKGMPKYLPMYISSEFYDFMSNKLFHADIIFSSHSQLFVKDMHFNRVDTVLAKIESLKVATHIPL
jgi:hypothetical protein